MSDNEISQERREELLNDLLREEGEAHLDPDWVLPGTSGVNEENSGEGEEDGEDEEGEKEGEGEEGEEEAEEDEEEQEEDGGRGEKRRERYLEKKREGYRRGMEREGKRVMSRGKRRTKKNEECRKVKTSNHNSLNPEAIKSRVKYNRRMLAKAKTEEQKEVYRKRLIIDISKTKDTKEEETTRTPTDPQDKDFLATISRCQSGKVVYREIEDALDSLVLKQVQRVTVAKKKIGEFLKKRDEVMGNKDWLTTVLKSSRSGKKNPSVHGKTCPLYGCGLALRDVPRHLSSVHNIDREDAVELNHLHTSASTYFDSKIDKDLLRDITILPRSTLKGDLEKRGVVAEEEEEPVEACPQAQAGVRESMYSEKSETLRWMVKCPAKHCGALILHRKLSDHFSRNRAHEKDSEEYIDRCKLSMETNKHLASIR